MHVLQRIAIRADSKDEAFYSVKAHLEEELDRGAWYDWFIAGGGRWNPNGDQYNDDDQSMTISYAEEPENFIDTVNEGVTARIDEFNRYRQYFNEKQVDINAYLDKYDGQTEFGMELYDLSKMIDLMQGKWDYNSYFFDLDNQSTNTQYMLKDLDKNGKDWFLVFVDFHF